MLGLTRVLVSPRYAAVKPDDLAGQIVGQLQRACSQIFVSGPTAGVGLVPDFLHPLDPKEIVFAPVSVFDLGIDDAQIPLVDMTGLYRSLPLVPVPRLP
jgi:hypothetical protein